jgi:hypothetical protein
MYAHKTVEGKHSLDMEAAIYPLAREGWHGVLS